jgi:16S rRNA (cytosine967-C5)-methyltransferase
MGPKGPPSPMGAGGAAGGVGGMLEDDRPLKAPRSFLKPLSEPIDGARDAVCELVAYQAGRFPHLEIAGLDESKLPPRDAGLAHAIYDVVIRRWLTLRHVIGSRVSQPVEGIETGVQAALLVGAAQLVLLDRVPAYAAIDHAVEWAKRRVRPGAGGFVNAVLRKVAAARVQGEAGRREGYAFGRDELPMGDGTSIVLAEPELPEDKTERLAVATSHAPQLIKTWLDAHKPEKVIELALHSLCQAPTVLNTKHAGFLPLGAEDSRAHGKGGFVVFTGAHETLSSLLSSRDDVWAQDAASAEAVESIKDLKPALIMDLCAGRGTKTRQLAKVFPQARIVATDVDDGRREELARAFKGHPRVSVVQPKGLVLEYSGQADLVLLDVPCSNTGVLARRPEAKYRFNRQNMHSLLDTQRQIIADTVALLSSKPGTAILYSTCSLDVRENKEIALWAAQWHKFKLSRERTAMPSGVPGRGGELYGDGAYSVLLSR